MRLRSTKLADVGTIRSWAERPELADYFRGLPQPSAWPSDAVVLSWFLRESAMIVEGSTRLGQVRCYISGDAAEIGVVVAEPGTQKRSEIAREALSMVVRALFAAGIQTISCRILKSAANLQNLLTPYGFRVVEKPEREQETCLAVTKEAFTWAPKSQQSQPL